MSIIFVLAILKMLFVENIGRKILKMRMKIKIFRSNNRGEPRADHVKENAANSAFPQTSSQLIYRRGISITRLLHLPLRSAVTFFPDSDRRDSSPSTFRALDEINPRFQIFSFSLIPSPQVLSLSFW